MFRFWKIAQFATGFTPLMERADAGSGGGAADPGETAGDPATGDEPGADLAAGVVGDGEDDEENDEDDPDLADEAPVTPERVKRMAAKLKKLNRRDRKQRPEAQRLRELKTQGITLDDLLHDRRTREGFEAAVKGNPRLARAIYGGDKDDEPASRRAAPAADPGFDESTLPFDPNETPTNRYFADLAKANHELTRRVKQLEGRSDQADGRDTQRTVREESQEWKRTLDAASGRIKYGSVRTALQDAFHGAFETRARHGKSAQQILTHYLTQFEKDGLLTPQEAAKAGAAAAAAKPGAPPARTAAQQRIAEGNRTLPRTVAPPGTPVPARTGRETLADVNKRIRRLAG